MSIHKLTAGNGYDYLTRQVAAMDSTELKAAVGLASYYTEKGETPGQWIGSGMAGIDGLSEGDVVTEQQLRNLLGEGIHPLADQIRDSFGADGAPAGAIAATRLGAPFPIRGGEAEVSHYRLEVAKRVSRINRAQGLPDDHPLSAQVRAQVRTQVARELFYEQYQRQPRDARELAATIAKHSRPASQTVAGYDLTFSPVKSVSALWAIADPATAAQVERAHQAAVKDALKFLEEHALFSRAGARGVRQVNVQGLVAAAFTHRDSRAGDPDLHTHVAVANKVQTLDGKWLAIDGRVLFKATVAASEAYNTALEGHLRAALGVQFAPRTNGDPRKQPVREIVGIDPALNQRWSTRRASIEARRAVLASDFQATHGRPPTPVESYQLAQQATLETRDPKHEPRTLAQQRTVWHAQAQEVLGGPAAVATMLHTTLSRRPVPGSRDSAPVDVQKLARTAIERVQQRRSTWQVSHVRAEAQRLVRAAGGAPAAMSSLVDQVTAAAMEPTLSVPLSRPEPGITEPAALRRRDGASMYQVAGSAQYTSAAILAAEQRIVAAAGRRDGVIIDPDSIDVALLESVANGVTLNLGQTDMVRAMATDPARVQLAIAPAGSGKTTAMRALATAWTHAGGTVLGLAPSAAAAAALGEQIQTHTDTLAKLVHALQQDSPARQKPDWVSGINRGTLVIIDEAGMADTLSLDTAIGHVLDAGGSVRLIGDDQQLSAVGAGGVLRDIQATHGAARLSELVRFSDPGEAAASLALRAGKPEALGFYLDHNRVHVGDLATMTKDLFEAWQADRGNGLDSLMLAPTRDLVAGLNRRARQYRLDTANDPSNDSSHRPATPLAEVTLSDGNTASVGDVIITRTNDRRLRTSATDWVKNGDRWLILATGNHPGTPTPATPNTHPATGIDAGALYVQHAATGRRITLPGDYVRANVELGYATTVHGAQGVTADTTHGLADTDQSRQQLYTMLTRGRHANHVYLQVVSDGDPHSLIHPSTAHPDTATDLLEAMLARDDAARSATTTARDETEPVLLLGQSAQRYHDAVIGGCEAVLGATSVHRIETGALRVVPGLDAQPAWQVLRSHLLLIAATGGEAVDALTDAAQSKELDTALDTAAVLDWRLDSSGLRSVGRGPLPWLPGIPNAVAADPTWGPYLKARYERVRQLSVQVAQDAISGPTPAWVPAGTARPGDGLLGEVSVWRAAQLVDDTDMRPLGRPEISKAAATHQRRLQQRLDTHAAPAILEWGPTISRYFPDDSDPFRPVLAANLAAMSRAGLPAADVLAHAATQGPLPDDHAAAALWWRITSRYPHSTDEHSGGDHDLTPTWMPRLPDLLGEHRAHALQESKWWPALATTIEHALQRGWALENLLPTGDRDPNQTGTDHIDSDLAAQDLLWQITALIDPGLDPDHEPVPDPTDTPPPDDLYDRSDVDRDTSTHTYAAHPHHDAPPHAELFENRTVTDDPLEEQPLDEPVDLAEQLHRAGVIHDALNDIDDIDPEPTGYQLRRAFEAENSPIPPARIADINELATVFYENALPTSWAQAHFTGRFGVDLTGDPQLRPGYAPAGWDHLVRHLRRHGVTDQEMLAAGVATTTRNGNLIDRFRDRAVLPIIHRTHGWENFTSVPFGGADTVLGFVGRRHLDATDHSNQGPKYLNTPDTALFSKGAQLFIADTDALLHGSIPVLVEGPMDAIAVTVATGASHVGVAPLGTALTPEQIQQLTDIHRHNFPGTTTHQANWPIVATDPDTPGQVAAHRDHWMLTAHGFDPGYLRLPTGTDPADLLAHHGPAALRRALDEAIPLANMVTEHHLTASPPRQALQHVAAVVATRPAVTWASETATIADRLRLPEPVVQQALLAAVSNANTDRNAHTRAHLDTLTAVREDYEHLAAASPTQRWETLAAQFDPRLPHQDDWTATAELLDRAHHSGRHLPQMMHMLVGPTPLGDQPAEELRCRIATAFAIPLDPAPSEEPPSEKTVHAALPAVQPLSIGQNDRHGITPPR